MECASCERLIEKAVASTGGAVRSIDASRGVAVLDYQEGKFDDVKRAIASAGYSISGEPTVAGTGAKIESAHHPGNDACPAKPLSFEKEMALFLRKLFGGEKELWAERKLLKMSLLSLLLLAFAGFFLYLFIWHGKAGFAPKIPFLFYSTLSAVSVIAAAAHYHSHKAEFTCMEGMMIGMTIGMVAGFLFGAVVGATNGMFVGSVFG
ncbi:MAG: heavy metal-associated domain-containing protein, partial [Bacteroidota bacterium]